MTYRYNLACSETNAYNWTPAAIDCYQLGCSCYKCYLNKIYFSKSNIKCHMKDSVIELVRKYGVPDAK